MKPYSLLKLLYLWLQSISERPGKALPAQEDPCHQQNLQRVPSSQKHEGHASSGLQFGAGSSSWEGVHGTWKISSRSVRSHLGCKNGRMENGVE